MPYVDVWAKFCLKDGHFEVRFCNQSPSATPIRIPVPIKIAMPTLKRLSKSFPYGQKEEVLRFCSKLHISTSGCLEWNAGRTSHGYGVFDINGKSDYVHRWSYLWANGKLTPKNPKEPKSQEIQVDHTCLNRVCVNPKHLEEVTLRVNVLRGNGVFAVNARKVQCPRGHRYSPDNTMIQKRPNSRGVRVCRTCARAAWHVWKKKTLIAKLIRDL